MHHNKLIFAILLFAVSLPLMAENSTKADGYTIHHNAFSTDTLSATVAKAYGIQRSKNRGMINISVIKDKAGTIGTSTAADVTVGIKRLIGRTDPVELKEIREDNAIYYIGVFGVVHGEKVNFDIAVKPEGSGKTLKASLKQEFYAN